MPRPLPRPLSRSATVRVLALPALGLAAALTGCRTTRTSCPVGADAPPVFVTEPVAAWEVRSSAELLGYVIHFERPGEPDRAFFSVRNAHLQDLGLVDRHGRAWRYRPHEPEPEWVGTATVADGARRLLGAPPASRLVPVDLADLAELGTPAAADAGNPGRGTEGAARPLPSPNSWSDRGPDPPGAPVELRSAPGIPASLAPHAAAPAESWGLEVPEMPQSAPAGQTTTEGGVPQ